MTASPSDEAIGCDVGGSAVKLVRLRRRRVSGRRSLPVAGEVSASSLLDLVVAATRELRSSGGAPAPLGVAVPGFLDRRRRKVVRLSNLPGLDGVPLASRLERRLGTRVLLDTDTNAGAVAEARLGAGRDHERVLYVSLGTGLGAALVVRGEPVRARHHTIGQVAHLPLDEDCGLRCPCGQKGCAEALLSARGIARRSGRSLTPEELYRAAAAGDRDARKAWKETGELLGRLLRLLVGLFSPGLVVVGGGVAGAGEFFLPAASSWLRRTLPRHLRTGSAAAEPCIVTAALGTFAGAIGAALLAKRSSADPPEPDLLTGRRRAHR